MLGPRHWCRIFSWRSARSICWLSTREGSGKGEAGRGVGLRLPFPLPSSLFPPPSSLFPLPHLLDHNSPLCELGDVLIRRYRLIGREHPRLSNFPARLHLTR